jgi:hypothetical protein
MTKQDQIRLRGLLQEADVLSMESKRLGQKFPAFSMEIHRGGHHEYAAVVGDPQCACNDGWVTLGQMVVDTDTGEEYEELATYLCKVCGGPESVEYGEGA